MPLHDSAKYLKLDDFLINTTEYGNFKASLYVAKYYMEEDFKGIVLNVGFDRPWIDLNKFPDPNEFFDTREIQKFWRDLGLVNSINSELKKLGLSKPINTYSELGQQNAMQIAFDITDAKDVAAIKSMLVKKMAH